MQRHEDREIWHKVMQIDKPPESHFYKEFEFTTYTQTIQTT
jgi:hypothetical protein